MSDAKAEAQLREVYAPLKLGNDRTLVMSVESAELAKVCGQRDAGSSHFVHE